MKGSVSAAPMILPLLEHRHSVAYVKSSIISWLWLANPETVAPPHPWAVVRAQGRVPFSNSLAVSESSSSNTPTPLLPQ